MQKALNTSEAAAYLGLSRGTLEVWRSLGKGPRYRKFGRRVLYELKDLDDYSASRIVETRDTAEILRGRHA
jgi:excisionase family DNA binding protein